MSFLDKAKDVAGKVGAAAKGAADAVTGKAAELTLKTKGAIESGGSIHATLTVKSAGNEVKAEGAFLDLRGEDPKAKNIAEKAIEAVAGDKAAKHTLSIHGAFVLQADKTQVFEADLKLPADLPKGLNWMVRGRIDTFGNDPDTGWIKYEG